MTALHTNALLILLQSMTTAASNSVIVLPYNIAAGKHKAELEKLFDVEYKTFSDLLALCDSCVTVKLNRSGGPAQLCGLLACWKVDTLKKSTATDLCSRFFGKLIKCPNLSGKYKAVIKIFSSSVVLLDTELLENIFEAFKDGSEAQEVVLVVNEKNESLIRFLKLRKCQDLKTDFLISGQELLCKTL